MKIGVIFFHSNLEKIYKKEWIDECIESIKDQTVSGIEIYEIDYSGRSLNLTGTSNFYSEIRINYADAMNFIISEAFNDGCKYVFNTNMDDKYVKDRIEKQIEYLNNGYDIVSSDFSYMDSDGNFIQNLIMSEYNSEIKNQLNCNHNVIAHPVVGYSKKFWDNNKYDIHKTPEEDLDLWKKSINDGYSFYIIPEILLMYRIHNNQVSTKK
jgi:hypothetical protein